MDEEDVGNVKEDVEKGEDVVKIVREDVAKVEVVVAKREKVAGMVREEFVKVEGCSGCWGS